MLGVPVDGRCSNVQAPYATPEHEKTYQDFLAENLGTLAFAGSVATDTSKTAAVRTNSLGIFVFFLARLLNSLFVMPEIL